MSSPRLSAPWYAPVCTRVACTSDSTRTLTAPPASAPGFQNSRQVNPHTGYMSRCKANTMLGGKRLQPCRPCLPTHKKKIDVDPAKDAEEQSPKSRAPAFGSRGRSAPISRTSSQSRGHGDSQRRKRRSSRRRKNNHGDVLFVAH